MHRVEMLWTVTLLAIGSIGGVVYNWPAQNDQQNIPNTATDTQTAPNFQRGLTLVEAQAEPTETEIASEEIDFEEIKIGDRLLTGGNYTDAYQHYSKLEEKSVGIPSGPILVRMGLASELAGFLDQAAGHYRTALQSPVTGPAQQAWALIGTARVWQRQGRLKDAADLLSELVLLHGTDDYPSEIRHTAQSLLSDCLQQEFLNSTSTTLLDRELLYSWSPVWIEPILSTDLRFVPPPEVTPNNIVKVIQNPNKDLSLALLDLKLPFYPLLELVGDLERELQVEFQISGRARSALAGRSVQIDSTALTAPVLLDQILAPLGLVWDFKERTVHVQQDAEVTLEYRRRFELDRIQRVLRQIQMDAKAPTLRVAALMHEANNRLLLDDLEGASNKYQAARDLNPSQELSAVLFFNHGLLLTRQNQKEDGLDKFYRALDQTMLPELQASAYGKIAQLELTLGRPDKAVPAASRGLKLAGQSLLAGQNLMVLAKSYLLEGNPFSANQVLFDFSSVVTDAKTHRLASVFANFARQQAVKPVSGLQNQGERLVLALAALQPDDAETFIDHLIVARALNAVGFRTKALDHLDRAAKGAKGEYWQDRISFELAEVLFQAANFAAAAEALEGLTGESNDALQVKIRILRAKSELALGKTDACISNCYELVQTEIDESSKVELLQLLGEAYQKAGKHYAAALCFAGLLPDNEQAEVQELPKQESSTEIQ